MMQLKTHSSIPENHLGDLSVFLHQIYAQHKHFDFFINEYQNAFNYCVNSQHVSFHPITINKNNQIIGHVALIFDDRLKQDEAFFGFFELTDDPVVFKKLWHQLTVLAAEHNIVTLKGPVNGSIWHQYRCVKEDQGDQYFRSEPITPLYYYRFLSQASPHQEISYSSGARSSFTELIKLLKQQKNTLKYLGSKGFTIQHETNLKIEQLRAILNLSKLAFSHSWGYTALDDNELANLHNIQKLNANVSRIYLLIHKDDIIGYCSALTENKVLYCKTICIRPEFQGRGLGGALALAIHNDAIASDIEEIKYVLVRDGNKIHQYPTKDVRIFRRYSAFDFRI